MQDLAERREYPVTDVIEALEIFSQPELLATDAKQVARYRAGRLRAAFVAEVAALYQGEAA